MNLLEIIIIAAVCLMAISGFRKGFVKKLASMLSLVLSVVLVSAVLPYVTDFIRESTPVYDYIVEQCEQAIAGQVSSLWATSGTEDGSASLEDLTRDEVKSLMQQYGYGDAASVIDSLSDEEFEAYKEQYLEQYISEIFSQSSVEDSSLTLDKSVQNEIIDSLPLPEAVRDMLINNNNDDGYKNLAVSNFQDYIVEFLANLILNVISFLVAVVLVQIVLRLLIMALNILAHFPGVGFVNRLAGLALGALEALFLLWLFFLILTILQATDMGAFLLAMVEESSVLSWLYESNLFLRIVLQAAALFTGV
ncbi:MAG: CvpA family protein [Lachnospiraceae bacterium]|nr:CvpA family protein [Lachnospiraceae bacterium]